MQATRDGHFLEAGAVMVDSLFNHTWTEGGWASIRSVATMEQEDHMWALAVQAWPPMC